MLDSQAFNVRAVGTGSFCTGFMAGGSVTPNATVNASDISVYANHQTSAFAPVGYGLFEDFTATADVTHICHLRGFHRDAGESLVTDSNGVFLGNASPTSIPEPSTGVLFGVGIVACYLAGSRKLPTNVI